MPEIRELFTLNALTYKQLHGGRVRFGGMSTKALIEPKNN